MITILTIKRFPAHDELCTSSASLVCPEQSEGAESCISLCVLTML